MVPEVWIAPKKVSKFGRRGRNDEVTNRVLAKNKECRIYYS